MVVHDLDEFKGVRLKIKDGIGYLYWMDGVEPKDIQIAQRLNEESENDLKEEFDDALETRNNYKKAHNLV